MTPTRHNSTVESTAPEVSVIMPVYNALPHLKQAVESVLAQSLADFELILVEDCGVDDSRTLCREYAEANNRVRLIEQPVNSGAAACRNAGLDVAQGEYVTFLDADDFMEPDTLARFIEVMKKYRVDMIRSSAAVHTGGTDLNFYNGSREPLLYSLDEDVRQIARCFVFSPLSGDGRDLNLGGAVWGTFYKRELIRDIRFPDRSRLPYCEDYSFNYQYARRCRSIAKLSQTLIHYREMPESLSRSTDPHFLSKAARVGEYFSALLRSNGDGDSSDRFAALLAISLLVAGAKRIYLSPQADRDTWKQELNDSDYFRGLRRVLPFSRLPLSRRIFLRLLLSRSSAALSIYFRCVEFIKGFRKKSSK